MPLHHVDPNTLRGRRYRALETFGRSRPGQFFSRHLLFPIDPWLYRTTRGRYPRLMGGVVTAPLVSTGAKSGLPREHQLAYFHDGRDAILIASNSGGPKNPQWYHNLRANPDCTLGDERFAATEVTDPAEYRRLYDQAEKVYAGYRDYKVTTARHGRHIPVFRLTPS